MTPQQEVQQLTRMLDAAWPIIEASRLLRARYDGSKDGVPKIAPDEAGAVIVALNNMEKTCNFAPVGEPDVK